MQPKLSILMCAYNEEQTIMRAVAEVLEVRYPCEIELIVVDDGSTDDTAKLIAQIRDPRVVMRSHANNRGKGAALITAVSVATGTYILPFDADLEYAPEDIPRMLTPVLQGRTQVVYGARLFGCNTVYHSYRYAAGNRLLTLIANLLFNSYLSDLHTCLKLIPLDLFRSLGLSETGFGLDTELTASLLRHGLRPFEVPVSYYGRSHVQGKKITWRDALRCVWILLRIRTARSSRPLSLSVALAQAPAHPPQRPRPSSEIARDHLPEVCVSDAAGGDPVIPAPCQLQAARS